jgi:two-component system cell cycle sensor histidine kinase/response regulator CckA
MITNSTSTILVVEDDAIISEDSTLRRLGYLVPRAAATGAQALRFAAELPPDLVLMDIKLKGDIDGIETVHRLQKSRSVPVVYLTGNSDESTLARARETGPHSYLLKPFNERDLRTTIEIALRKFEFERHIAERERWFSTTLESIGDAVIATDDKERITFMNAVAEVATGWNRADATGRPVAEVLRLIDGANEPIADPVRRALRTRFAVTLPADAKLVQRDGTERAIDDAATPIVDAKGILLGGVVVFRDVTDRKRLEQRVALSERLASVGTMTAGMAHEINSPLAAVMSNLEFSLDELRGPLDAAVVADVVEALSDALHAGRRVRSIIQDLKRFTRIDVEKRTVLDLPTVLDEAIKMTESQVRHSARIVREYATTPFVLADEARLSQVFVNLIINAAQAIDDGAASEHRIVVRTMVDDGGRAVVEVSDTGKGIPPDIVARIFDPFFTTKAVGAGMGLGLTICHRIIADLGGETLVDSEPGRGTTIRVVLPAATEQALLPVEDVRPAPVAKRRGRVLVIDDEPAIGRAIQRVLGAAHDVVVETSARLALQRLAGEPNFDVILCDLMMPNLGGVDVFASLSASAPELAKRIVFLTGGATSARSDELLATTANIVLAKPFTSEALRRIVVDYVT